MNTSRTRPASLRALTLIELVGALTIVALLAAVLAPNLTRRLTQAFRDAEQRSLESLAKATREVVRRSHAIPGPTNFAAVVGAGAGLTPGLVLTNPFGSRRIVFDDGFRVGTNTGARPPYTQGPTGSRVPANARLMIVSSTGTPLPVSLVSGFMATNTFTALWETPPSQVPAGWSWNGDPADLRIQRVNLENLFVQVILNNQGSPTGRFSLDGGFTNVIPSATFSTHVLVGTRLGLHLDDGTLHSVQVVDEPISFVYSGGSWQSQMSGSAASWQAGQHLDGCDLQAAAEYLLTVPKNPRSCSTPYDFVVALGNLMQKYLDYANSGFKSSKKSAYVTARSNVENIANHFMD